MKNILLIGVGGTGSKAVDIFYKKKEELGNQTGNNITALVFDTDAGDLKRITAAKTVVMADNASVGTICDRFGREYLKEWFPCDDKAVRAQEMVRGASQWRKKSYLAFLNLMNKPLARSTFISALESMTADPSASCEVYIIASIAGGTGSGSFIPIALYAKRYLRKNLGKDPIINAMIALPDIYADAQTPENKIKVYSNAYAILRELNAINLVARNYNAGVAEHKKAPIRFRIGDPKEPSVGLLFDASDKQFWTPEAAPFSQVFLLDRIPGLNTVTAHDIVLANSLYTILCTDIGAAFDSEFSNHELLRSQNNGSNAIYAGISTAQIRFPKESVLDYLAHKKTLDACDSEWLVLHNAVEAAIKEREQQAKACNRPYTMEDDEYANLVVEKAHSLEDANNEAMIAIMERAVYRYDKDERRLPDNAATEIAKKIEQYINGRIPAIKEVEAAIEEARIADKGKIEKGSIPETAKTLYQNLLVYYQTCIEKIKTVSKSTADSILCLDKKKLDFVNPDVSVVDAIMKKKDGEYVHPVAAMFLLCEFRKAINKHLAKKGTATGAWEDIKKRTVEDIPSTLLAPAEITSSAAKKSAYVKSLGEERFASIITENGEEEYNEIKKTDVASDLKYVLEDAGAILQRIYRGAQAQLRDRVYTAIARDIDLLISKYRSFFKRFEKEKEELAELTKTAYRKDAGPVDSVINVFSSIATDAKPVGDKDYIYKSLVTDGTPATQADIAATDNIVGLGVFNTVYASASATYSDDRTYNDKDSGAYRSLFGSMVKAYRDSIRKSDEFEQIASYNAIEAIAATCGEQKDFKKVEETFKQVFAMAQELATPSLRLDPTANSTDLVRPSNIMVFMMSENTGRYLKKHADELGLHMPADQNKESDVIKACAEEFIHRYSGNNSARVSIVSSMPDQVLYCTGEIMDITPLRIAKFNELGDDNLYFRNYSLALANHKKYGTDMWNPHLGNNLHKRGYLPYMNESKERECDVMVVKALLHAFNKEYICYKPTYVTEGTAPKYYFCYNNKKLTDSEGKWIDSKGAASLVAWLRNEDELVEEWSAAFDVEIQRQMNALPSIASENQEEKTELKSKLTGSDFMQLLTVKLYDDASYTGIGAKKYVADSANNIKVETRKGPTAIEFAYMVKTTEELGRDCDDAERILDVLYDIFKDMCAYRADPAVNPDRFIEIYRQQIGKVYESVATARLICEAKDSCEDLFYQRVQWFHQSGVFDTVSDFTPMDEKGNVCIDTIFDHDKSKTSKANINAIFKAIKEKKKGE